MVMAKQMEHLLLPQQRLQQPTRSLGPGWEVMFQINRNSLQLNTVQCSPYLKVKPKQIYLYKFLKLLSLHEQHGLH